MSDYKRGDRRGSRRDYDRKDFNRRGPPREMHKAVCDKCGNDCEVPFAPTSGKPIFCTNCFEKKDGGGGSSRSRNFRDRGPRRSSSRPSYARGADSRPRNSEQLAEIINKLDEILKVITPPTLTEEEVKTKKKDAVAKVLSKKKVTKKKTSVKKAKKTKKD
ncbi:CxxC-x17-CxxC domain-containing protein [Patescibacteria group bacterium]